MSTKVTDDRALALIAESILDASDEEIARVATANGVDVAALEQKVRAMIEKRISAAQASDRTSFGIGETVALRSDPGRIGVVTSITPSNRETRYGVFIDGRMEMLYASQLTPADIAPSVIVATTGELNARLTALQLTAPSLANLYSLQAGRIDFIPYQFRPVLKFIRADRPRLLVADEVGVGKTIESGLLLRELQARRPLRSVLIVCSKALVVEEKWQREMRRFDENFVALSSVDLRHCLEQTDLDGEWPERYARAILPFSLFNENLLNGHATRNGGHSKGLLTLDAPPRFDLLIVDEAHNARNADTNLHQGLRVLADNAEAVVLLTAHAGTARHRRSVLATQFASAGPCYRSTDLQAHGGAQRRGQCGGGSDQSWAVRLENRSARSPGRCGGNRLGTRDARAVARISGARRGDRRHAR